MDFLLAVVSHIHVTENLASLIKGNKISQPIFDYNESDHLQCMIEIFKNSETKSKKSQNKI